jgi:phosphatidylserine/phosphatidylglycerophosphate/cardiolipin synthase-like enzyme
LPADDVPQHLHRLYHDRDTINIFFNQQAFTELALPGNEANHQINLEDRIIDRIRQARHRIDVAVYELNLPAIVTALMDRAAEGVQVRLIVDAKEPSNFDRNERFRLMRVYLEQLRRGHDGIIGTRDDVALFANSPIFAVTNPIYRRHHDLPETLEAGWQPVTLRIGKGTSEGHLLVDGALNKPGIYYAPGGQMHNKFILIDDYRVLTGSLNLTETGIYGSRQDRLQRRLNGNANNLLDIHSTTLTTIYRDEFNQMWGSTDLRPNPVTARFRGRKIDQPGPHQLTLGDTQVQVFFSPGYNVIPAIRDYIQAEADESLYFCIFAWSDSELENAIKQKWEGNPLDSQGELTGFRVKGVFERIFWNQWWSASINMMGEMAGRSSPRNPNIRWRHAPPVFRDRETRKLHHKYMLVDAENPSRNPTVITGSANWSRNANESNDENTLFIHDPLIANQYVQEFYARYQQAGGSIDHGATRLASSGFPTPDTP